MSGAVLVALVVIAGCARERRPQPTTRAYHFSVDDVTAILSDLATRPYKSMFEQPALGFLRQLHERYGAKVSLYVFYEGEGFDLSKMPARYKQEFEANADWLKLGFHSRDKSTRYLEESEACASRARRDYQLVIKEITRLAGEKSLTPFVRFHLWEISGRALGGLREAGLRGVLVTREQADRERGERRESRGVTWSVDEGTGVAVIATDLAFEEVPSVALERELAKLTPKELRTFEGFVHEPFLSIPGTRKSMEKAAKLLKERGYGPVHYEEVIAPEAR